MSILTKLVLLGALLSSLVTIAHLSRAPADHARTALRQFTDPTCVDTLGVQHDLQQHVPRTLLWGVLALLSGVNDGRKKWRQA